MRVKTGKVTRRRHKKILKANKGYRMTKSKLYKVAKEAFMHAGQYAYNDRQKRAGTFRRLWISRINAGAQANGKKYNVFMSDLREANVELNRKMLADLALNNPEVFTQIATSF